MSDSEIVLNLPAEEEIQTTAEMRMPAAPGLIRKTIRYKNGMELTLLQDFQELVFSLSLKFAYAPFRLKRNRILKLTSNQKKS